MMLFGGYLISAGSPSLAGWVRDSGGTYMEMFAAMAVLSSAILTLALFLRPRVKV
jgi:cyanate permease